MSKSTRDNKAIDHLHNQINSMIERVEHGTLDQHDLYKEIIKWEKQLKQSGVKLKKGRQVKFGGNVSVPLLIEGLNDMKKRLPVRET